MKLSKGSRTVNGSPFKNTKKFGNHTMSMRGTKIKEKGGRSLANMIDELVSAGP